MAPTKPAGPRPILVGGLALGGALVAAACWHPSLHIFWQAPLGMLLIISSMGKMVSR